MVADSKEPHDPAQQQEYSPKNNRSATMEALALTETTDKTAAQSASNEAPDALAAHKQKQLPRGGLGTVSRAVDTVVNAEATSPTNRSITSPTHAAMALPSAKGAAAKLAIAASTTALAK